MKYQDIKHLLKKGMTVNVITAKCGNDSIHLGKQTLRVGKQTLRDYHGGTGEWSTDKAHFIDEDDELEIISNPDGSKWCNHNPSAYGECIGCAQDSINPYFSKPFNWIGSQAYSVPNGAIESLTNEPKAQKGFIMNVVDKIKNFKLTKEDRILRENGLEDEDGKMTGLAGEMMSDECVSERWATRRLEVAKDLLEIKNEEIKK